MGKKNRNRPKKESPWKDVPVTSYDVLHPKNNQDPDKLEQMRAEKKKQKDMQNLMRLNRQKAPGISHTRGHRKIPKNVQRVPIQATVPVGVDKETGEPVVAKVKTNKFRTIVHARKTG